MCTISVAARSGRGTHPLHHDPAPRGWGQVLKVVGERERKGASLPGGRATTPTTPTAIPPQLRRWAVRGKEEGRDSPRPKTGDADNNNCGLRLPKRLWPWVGRGQAKPAGDTTINPAAMMAGAATPAGDTTTALGPKGGSAQQSCGISVHQRYLLRHRAKFGDKLPGGRGASGGERGAFGPILGGAKGRKPGPAQQR